MTTSKEISASKITVALVCYKEKEQLALILNDIKNQTVFYQITEVLLFQNGNCKTTKQVAKSFCKKLPLIFLSTTSNNLGLARHELVNKAQGDWIAFTDSDCRLSPIWLETLIENWLSVKDNNLVAIGGPNRLPENKTWQRIFNLSLEIPIGHGWSPQAWKVKKPNPVWHIPTTNALFLKQAILKAGNFSKNFYLAGEDLDLGLRLKKQGSLLLFPKPLVINQAGNSYWKNLKRLFIFGSVQTGQKRISVLIISVFFPCLMLGLVLSFFSKTLALYFLLLAVTYFLSLWFCSLYILFKTTKLEAIFLPIFWFLQHLFYSLGLSFLYVKKTIKFFY